MTKRVRITIEYEIDQTLEEERQDWINGNVDFRDLWSLVEGGDKDITTRFEELSAEREPLTWDSVEV